LSSETTLRLRAGARRYLPWIAWALAAAAAVGLNVSGPGLGVAPATADVRAVALSSQTPLRLVSLEVRAGERVRAGQLLARLDATRADAQLAGARAKLDQLQLDVRAKELTIRADRFKISDREALQTERLALDLVDLEAEQKRDVAQLGQLDEQLERQSRLVKEQLASADALNELKLHRAALAQKVDAYTASLARARANLAAAKRRAGEWKTDQVKDPVVEQQIAPLRSAALAQAEEVKRLELLRDSLDLKAPFDGQVSEVLLRPGDTVRTGRPVVTVIEERPTTAVAWVDQSWAARVQVGDEVSLSPVDHAGPPLKGRVTSLGPAITETPRRFQLVPNRVSFSREAHIEVEPGASAFVPGQAFNAAFRHGPGESATLVGFR
jgi:multidrug resistance efflux pump